jgi:hypothetical protein
MAQMSLSEGRRMFQRANPLSRNDLLSAAIVENPPQEIRPEFLRELKIEESNAAYALSLRGNESLGSGEPVECHLGRRG